MLIWHSPVLCKYHITSTIIDSGYFSFSQPPLQVQRAFWNVTLLSRPRHRWGKRTDGYVISVLHGPIIYSLTVIQESSSHWLLYETNFSRLVSTTIHVANHTHLPYFVGPYHRTIVLSIRTAAFRSTKTVWFLFC